MKLTLHFFLVSLIIFSSAVQAAIPPQPAAGSALVRRQRMALALATAWNKSASFGDFLERNVENGIPVKSRQEIRRLTEGYGWFPLPQALPLEDGILFHDRDFRTVSVLRFLSVSPLVIEQDGRKIEVRTERDLMKYFAEVNRGLPALFRAKTPKLTWEPLRRLPALLLEPDAQAIGPLLAFGLGAAVAAGGALAYSSYHGVESSSTDVTVNVNFPDQMKVNMRNITEEEKQKSAEALRQGRLSFRHDLGSWVGANISAGSCGPQNGFAPNMVTKGSKSVPPLSFKQTVENGIDTLSISRPGSPQSFTIQKAFTANHDVTGDHRIFNDEVTVVHQCQENKCREISQADLGAQLAAYLSDGKEPELEQATEAELKQASQDLDALGQKLTAMPSSRKINDKYSADDAWPTDEEKRVASDLRSTSNALYGEDKPALEAAIQEAQRSYHSGFFSSWSKDDSPSRFDVEYYADMLMYGSPIPNEPAYMKDLEKSLSKSGRLAELQGKYKSLESLRAQYSGLFEKKYAEAGLASDGSYKPGESPRDVLLGSDVCQRYKASKCNGDALFRDGVVDYRSNQFWPDGYAKLKAQILDSIRQKLDRYRQNREQELGNEIFANYSLAMCCDEKECRDTLSAQMSLATNRGNGDGDAPAGEPSGEVKDAR